MKCKCKQGGGIKLSKPKPSYSSVSPMSESIPSGSTPKPKKISRKKVVNLSPQVEEVSTFAQTSELNPRIISELSRLQATSGLTSKEFNKKAFTVINSNLTINLKKSEFEKMPVSSQTLLLGQILSNASMMGGDATQILNSIMSGGGAGSSAQRQRDEEENEIRRLTLAGIEQTRKRNEEIYRNTIYTTIDKDFSPILQKSVEKGSKYIKDLTAYFPVSNNLSAKYIFDELKKHIPKEKATALENIIDDGDADANGKIILLKHSLASLLLDGQASAYQSILKNVSDKINKATAVDYGQTPQEDTEIEGGGAGSSKSKKKKKESKYEVPEQAPPSRPTQAFTGDSTENADFLRSLLQPMREDQSQSRPRGRPRRQQPQQESSPPPQPPRPRGRPRGRSTLETIIETPRTPRLDIIQRQPIVEEPDTPRQQRPQYRPLSNLEVSEYINYSFDRLRDYYLTLPNTSLAQFNGIIYASILSVKPNRVSEIEESTLGKTPEEAYTILKKVLSNLQDFTTTEGAGSSILKQISQYVSRASTREGMGRKRGRPRKVSVPIPPKKQRGRPRKSI